MRQAQLTLIAILLCAGAATAQTTAPAPVSPQAPSAPGAEPVEEIGPWRLICGETGEGCVARQTVHLDEKDPEIVLDLFLTPGPGNSATLSLVTTLDVLIEPGVSISRSQPMTAAPVWHGDFVACGVAGCQANGFFDPDSVYGAEDPVAVIVSADAQTLAVPVSMALVKDALERVKPDDAE